MKNKSLIYFILLPIIVSITVSIVTSVYTNRSLERYLLSLDTESQFATQIATERRALPDSYEEALQDIQRIQEGSLALLRDKVDPEISPNAFLRADSDAVAGIVLTSDGWILFDSVDRVSVDDLSNTSSVWIGDTVYEIEDVSARQEGIYVKVNASGLATVPFANTDQVIGGELLFGLSTYSGVYLSSITDSEHFISDTALPDYAFARHWLIEEMPEGSLVFNSSAEFVGFAQVGGQIQPLHVFEEQIKSFLRTGEVTQSGMGVYVIDAQYILNVDHNIYPQLGALISAPSGQVAVISGSPAADADLRQGDMLLSVDGIPINKGQSLAALLSKYSPSETVEIDYIRSGERGTVEVRLVSTDELSY